MNIAPKLSNCQVSMSYFIKNYGLFLKAVKQPGNTSMIVHVTIVILIF